MPGSSWNNGAHATANLGSGATVAQLTLDQKVEGSNPSSPATPANIRRTSHKEGLVNVYRLGTSRRCRQAIRSSYRLLYVSRRKRLKREIQRLSLIHISEPTRLG